MLIALRDASLQEGSRGRQERVASVTTEAGGEWLVSVTDTFTIGDGSRSGPHHISGELEECVLTAYV